METTLLEFTWFLLTLLTLLYISSGTNKATDIYSLRYNIYKFLLTISRHCIVEIKTC